MPNESDYPGFSGGFAVSPTLSSPPYPQIPSYPPQVVTPPPLPWWQRVAWPNIRESVFGDPNKVGGTGFDLLYRMAYPGATQRPSWAQPSQPGESPTLGQTYGVSGGEALGSLLMGYFGGKAAAEFMRAAPSVMPGDSMHDFISGLSSPPPNYVAHQIYEKWGQAGLDALNEKFFGGGPTQAELESYNQKQLTQAHIDALNALKQQAFDPFKPPEAQPPAVSGRGPLEPFNIESLPTTTEEAPGASAWAKWQEVKKKLGVGTPGFTQPPTPPGEYPHGLKFPLNDLHLDLEQQLKSLSDPPNMGDTDVAGARAHAAHYGLDSGQYTQWLQDEIDFSKGEFRHITPKEIWEQPPKGTNGGSTNGGGGTKGPPPIELPPSGPLVPEGLKPYHFSPFSPGFRWHGYPPAPPLPPNWLSYVFPNQFRPSDMSSLPAWFQMLMGNQPHQALVA